jgi:hypothetical protein
MTCKCQALFSKLRFGTITNLCRIVGRQMVGQSVCATMDRVPDHTDQRELLKKFIDEGRPATLEAIAEVVEGGSDDIRKPYRDQTGESALAEVVLRFDSSLPTGLEQMMREMRGVQQPDRP